MNPNEITAEQVRQQLRQWDSPFPWGYKPSKTIALLDRTYSMMPLQTFCGFAVYAQRKISEFFGSPGSFNSIYTANLFDCENFSEAGVAFMKMRWAKENPDKKEPAVFRIVIKGKPNHSIVIAFLTEGIHFTDIQTGQIWSIASNRPNILAVT